MVSNRAAFAALAIIALVAAGPALGQLQGQVFFNQASGAPTATDSFAMPSTSPPNCTDCITLPDTVSVPGFDPNAQDSSKIPYYLSVTGAPGNTIFGVAAFSADRCQGTPTNATFYSLQGDSFDVDPTSTFSTSVKSLFICGSTTQ